jgi:hypothetical protein
LDYCVFFADDGYQCSLFGQVYIPVKDTLSAHMGTGAIALRISVTGGPLRSMTTLWLIALVIVESSTLYALSVIATLATFLSGSNWQYPLVDAIVLLVVSREPFRVHLCPQLIRAFTLGHLDHSSDSLLCHRFNRSAKRWSTLYVAGT